jgi:hypothetical protein
VQQVQTKVIDDLKNVTQIQQGEIDAIVRLPYFVLYLHIHSKNEDGLDKQVDNDETNDGREKLAFAHLSLTGIYDCHSLKVFSIQ